LLFGALIKYVCEVTARAARKGVQVVNEYISVTCVTTKTIKIKKIVFVLALDTRDATVKLMRDMQQMGILIPVRQFV
jgi:hypothetical protein